MIKEDLQHNKMYIGFYLDYELNLLLEKYCTKEERSKSFVLRQIIKKFTEKIENEEKINC